MMSDYVDELELVLAVFAEATLCSPRELVVDLSHRFKLRITIPEKGYPTLSAPSVSIIDGPNAVLISLLERALVKRLETETLLGSPMITSVIQIANEVSDDVAEDARQEQEHLDEQRQSEESMMNAVAMAQQCCGIDILPGEPIVDRKSKFLAHVARVTSVTDVMNVVQELRSQRAIACAAHPAIWAYRFRDAQGVLHQDADDDGETGASKKMLFLMDSLNVLGCVVVVTRWFGGVLLGPDRFKHIMTCTRQALQDNGMLSS